MRTQVGIVGAGPAGLMLSHLLHLDGIESVVLEARSREYVEQRLRAGLLEQGTVDLLVETGAGERLLRQGIVHHGITLRFGGGDHRIDFNDLAGGRAVTIYAQHEVIKDLIAARLAAGGQLLFEAGDVALHDLGGAKPSIRFSHNGAVRELICDFIAGCDGFHGVCRASAPVDAVTVFEREYPFAWLGVLAEAPPSAPENVYCYHDRGFALLTMRTPRLSRLYLQCAPDEDLAGWPDERIWEELAARSAVHGGRWTLNRGPIVQRGVADLRSFVVEPMQYGRLFLAGDAAHIVPPTGAKGLNLAVADVRVLARALADFYASGRRAVLDEYSATCLRRVWKVQRFSWWMTAMLHRFEDENAFDRRQLAELEHVTSSRAAAQALAENYVGLPLD